MISSTSFLRERLSSAIWPILAAAALWLLAAGCSSGVLPGISPGDKGAIDLLQYWSACRLAWAGLNPYDPVEMYELQKSLGSPFDAAIMMWNPPWLLPLFAPIALFPFFQAASIWLLLNVVLMVASILILCRTFLPREQMIIGAAVAAVFYPLWETLLMGQLSIGMLFYLALSLHFFARKNYFWCGVFLAPLTIKPHLVFLPAIALAYWALRTRRSDLILGFFTAFAILCGLTALVSAQLFRQWFESFGSLSAAAPAVPVAQWKTATVAGLLRSLLAGESGAPPSWPLWLVPTAAALGVLCRLFTRRLADFDPWESLPWLLCLSLAASPYGWMYDQALLLPVQLIILRDGCARGRLPTTVGLLLGMQVLIFAVALLQIGQDAFFWVPLGLLALWGFSRPGPGTTRS